MNHYLPGLYPLTLGNHTDTTWHPTIERRSRRRDETTESVPSQWAQAEGSYQRSTVVPSSSKTSIANPRQLPQFIGERLLRSTIGWRSDEIRRRIARCRFRSDLGVRKMEMMILGLFEVIFYFPNGKSTT
eukprot:s731_g24.t1